MNVTEKILNDPKHVSDVRKTSQGDTYPYGVVVRMDAGGTMFWEGFHATKGVYTGLWRANRRLAVSDIYAVVDGGYYD